MIDKEVMKQRKKVYGNNFPAIAKNWSDFLGINITERDVAMMMAQMKETRIIFIKDKLNDLKDMPDFSRNEEALSLCKQYKSSLEDSIKDKSNYLFIATNYDEYLSL